VLGLENERHNRIKKNTWSPDAFLNDSYNLTQCLKSVTRQKCHASFEFCLPTGVKTKVDFIYALV